MRFEEAYTGWQEGRLTQAEAARLGRPLYGLLVLFLIGGIVFRWMSVPAPTTEWDAAILSISSLFSIFPGAGKIVEAKQVADLPSWLRLFAVLQSLFGALLLFLIGLALRNRFRMK